MKIFTCSTRFSLDGTEFEATFLVKKPFSQKYGELAKLEMELVEVLEDGKKINTLSDSLKETVEDYCWMEYDMNCAEEELAGEVCECCGNTCTGDWRDFGVGLNEAWGVSMVHVDMQYVSDCCDSPLEPPSYGDEYVFP